MLYVTESNSCSLWFSAMAAETDLPSMQIEETYETKRL